MKIKIILTLFVVLMCGIMYNSPVKAGDIQCAEFDAECTPAGNWIETYKTFFLPEFPGCQINVFYKWRQCAGYPHSTQWIIDEIILGYGSCQSLIQWLSNNGAGMDMDKYIEWKTKIVRHITLENFINWYDAAPQAIKDAVQCSTGNYHLKSTYYQKTCTKLCFATVDEDGVLKYILREVDCVDVPLQACCAVTYKYCVENDEVQITTETSGHYANCYIAPWPDPSGCPENTVDMEIIWCRDNCLDE